MQLGVDAIAAIALSQLSPFALQVQDNPCCAPHCASLQDPVVGDGETVMVGEMGTVTVGDGGLDTGGIVVVGRQVSPFPEGFAPHEYPAEQVVHVSAGSVTEQEGGATRHKVLLSLHAKRE